MKYLIINLAIYMGICLLLTACGGATGTAGGNTMPQQAENLPGVLLLDVAGSASFRSTSEYVEIPNQGNQPYLCSTGACGEGSSLTLDASTNGPGGGDVMEWAVYGFDPQDKPPVSVEVVFNSPAVEEAWIGFADYSKEVWQWHGPVQTGGSYTVSDDKYMSPGGHLYCAVVATAGDSVIVNAVALTIDMPDGEAVWGMFGRNRRHDHRSPYVGAQTNNVKWVFETGATIECTPAIAANGTIYFGSSDSKVYALDPDGSEKWAYTTGQMVWSSPAIAVDGTIYVGSFDHFIYALTSAGALKWSYETNSAIDSSPAISVDGTVYIGSMGLNGFMYAINPDGKLKWTYEMNYHYGTEASPAIGSDGTVYFGSRDGYLHAVDPDGNQNWTRRIHSATNASPAIAPDGTVYAGSDMNDICATNPDGTEKWSYTTGGDVSSSPALGADGTVYAGSNDGKLYAINPDGSLKWEFTTGDSISCSPTIGADGTIYFGSWDDYVYALSPDGTLKWSYLTEGSVFGSASIGADGTVYIAGGTKLYAFADEA